MVSSISRLPTFAGKSMTNVMVMRNVDSSCLLLRSVHTKIYDGVPLLTQSRHLATSTGNEDEDYEIDLISMKKTPKAIQRKKKGFVDPNVFRSKPPVNDTKSETLVLTPDDLNQIESFAKENRAVLEEFQIFLRNLDNTDTILGINHLKISEIEEYLKLFTQSVKDGEIDSVSLEECEYSLNGLNNLKDSSLVSEKLNEFLQQEIAKYFYFDFGAWKFIPEIRNVSKFTDLKKSKANEIANILEHELNQFKSLEVHELGESGEIGEDYFMALIQVKRYEALKEFLLQFDTIPLGLAYIAEDPKSELIAEKFASQRQDISHLSQHKLVLSYVKRDILGGKLFADLRPEELLNILYQNRKDTEDCKLLFDEMFNLLGSGRFANLELSMIDKICEANDDLLIMRQFLIQRDFAHVKLRLSDVHGPTVRNIILYYTDVSSKSPSSKLTEERLDHLASDKRELEQIVYDMQHCKIDEIENLSILAENIFHVWVSKYDHERSLHPREYTEIPDDLQIYKYVDQLETFRVDWLCNQDFGELEEDYIMDELDEFIETLGLDQKLEFRKLKNQLDILFSINYGDTSVLDTLIHSQSVFNNFEKKIVKENEKSTSNTTYFQVPEGFALEEYVNELITLQKTLGSNFASIDCKSILQSLQGIIDEIPDSNPEKVLYRKLFRNLTILFKYNNEHAFVLDQVILNSKVFKEFELKHERIRSNESHEIDPALVETFELVQKHAETLKQIREYNNWGSFTVAEFARISTEDFNIALKACLSKVEQNETYNVPMFKFVISSLQSLNPQVEKFPLFLYSLVDKAKNGYSILELGDVEELYKNCKGSVPPIKVKAVSMQEKDHLFTDAEQAKENKFDILDFMTSRATLKDNGFSIKNVTYNDPEHVSSKIPKGNKPLEENTFFTVQEQQEKILKEKYNYPREKVTEDEELESLTAENIRKSYRQETSIANDTSVENLEGFLRNAKKEKELKKERKFRESKAYDWSTSMCNSHRSLESGNFFSPLSSFGGDSSRLLFPEPSASRGRKEYLLWTGNGSSIKSSVNPLGPNHIEEDMFTVLNKFPRHDLHKLIKNVKKQQRRNWKIIGGGGDGEKLLVFARDSNEKRDWIFSKLRTLLAGTGAMFLSLVGINWWLGEKLEEVSYGPVNQIPSTEIAVIGNGPEETVVSIPVLDGTDPVEVKKSTSWKSWLWSSRL